MIIDTQVFVAAPPSAVWRVLTDFAAYEQWNPLIPRLEGRAEPGAKLRETIRVPGRKPGVLTSTITALEPEKELRWVGGLPIGLFRGEHTQTLAPRDGGTLVRNREVYSGPFARLAGRRFYEAVEQGFNEANAALKRRVEG